MGKKKSRTSRASSGKMAKIRKARAEKREAKFAAKREAGLAYEYKKNPFKEGSKEWAREKMERANKTHGSKCEYAKFESIMQKLDNYLEAEKEKIAAAKAEEEKKKKKSVAA